MSKSDIDETVLAHLRTHDFDWYAALHFVPASRRAPLVALFAFLAELGRIRGLITDPMAGEIRLQWWRDVLAGTGHGAVDANPLARALLAAIDEYHLPVEPLMAAIDARTFDLYDDAFPTDADLEGYAGEILSSPLAIAASLLTGDNPEHFSTVAGHTGVAVTSVQMLDAFPVWARRGQCYIPQTRLDELGVTRDVLVGGQEASRQRVLMDMGVFAVHHIHQARAGLDDIDAGSGPLWLPLNIVARSLQGVERWAANPFDRRLKPLRWKRLYHLWRASKKPVNQL